MARLTEQMRWSRSSLAKRISGTIMLRVEGLVLTKLSTSRQYCGWEVYWSHAMTLQAGMHSTFGTRISPLEKPVLFTAMIPPVSYKNQFVE